MRGQPWRVARTIRAARRRVFLSLGLCYALYFGLAVYSEFRRPEELGIRLTYAADDVYVATVAPDSPGARAGLKAGDRITRIGTAPLATLHDRFSFHARLPFDRPIPIGWIRDGAEMSSVLTLVTGKRDFWGTHAGVTLLLMRGAQLLMLGLAVVIVWKQQDSRALVGAWLLASLGVYSILLPPRLSATWRELPAVLEAAMWLPYLSSTCVGAVLATFYTVFPEKALRWRTLLAVIWSAAVPLLAVSAYDRVHVMYAPNELPLSAAVMSLPAIGNLVFIAAGALIMVRNYRRLSSETERRRVRLVLTSSAFVCLSGAIAVAYWASSGTADLAGGLFSSWTLSIGVLPSALVPFCFAYAILRHRMFDISLLLRRGLEYALARRVLLSLMPAIVLVFALDAYSQWHEHAGLRQGRIWWYAALLAAAAWSYSRREAWLDALDRRYFRERYSATRLLRELAEDLQQRRGIADVLPAVVGRIEAALHPQYVALLVRSQDGRFYESPASHAAEGRTMPRFSAGDKVIRLLAVLGRPLIIGPSAPHTAFDQLPVDEQQAIETLATELLVPVAGPGDTLEALLALGMKRSEEPFSSEDLDLLGAIAMNLRASLPPSTTTEECDTCGGSYATGTGRCAADGAVLMPSATPPVLAERYAIERRLGRGGMGVVYAARDLQLNRRIAIKLLGRIESGRDAERLRREARAAATLSHPNVVTIHDIGVTPDARPFLVMELLHGATLRESLASGPLEASAIDPVFEGICAALDAAHAAGLVHRDLKPENVLLLNGDERAGTVKLLDFGISLFMHDRGTGRSGVLGTPEYAAPEQIRGEPPTRAWDLWALGVMAFEAIVGTRPVACAAATLWTTGTRSVATWDSPALERLSPSRAAFFSRALSIDPAARPASASQFLRELREASPANG